MRYNRQDALLYAELFAFNVCHDGRVATKGGYPRAPAGEPLDLQDHIVNELDCTHYVSCCVGQAGYNWSPIPGSNLSVKGGGLKISSPFAQAGVYGETYAPRLVGALIAVGAKVIGKEFMDLNSNEVDDLMRSKMAAGDVVAYADNNGKPSYEHFGFLCSSTTVACHTRSRFDESYRSVFHPLITLLKLPS